VQQNLSLNRWLRWSRGDRALSQATDRAILGTTSRRGTHCDRSKPREYCNHSPTSLTVVGDDRRRASVRLRLPPPAPPNFRCFSPPESHELRSTATTRHQQKDSSNELNSGATRSEIPTNAEIHLDTKELWRPGAKSPANRPACWELQGNQEL
jgi:hypothetical protein